MLSQRRKNSGYLVQKPSGVKNALGEATNYPALILHSGGKKGLRREKLIHHSHWELSGCRIGSQTLMLLWVNGSTYLTRLSCETGNSPTQLEKKEKCLRFPVEKGGTPPILKNTINVRLY